MKFLVSGLTGTMLIAGSVIATSALGSVEIKALAHARAEEALLVFGFGIAQVSLTGHHHTSDNDVYEALDLEKARTYLSFDAAAALKRIEGLPWVETAQITRDYPGALRIELRERQPMALWTQDEKTYLIDATGRVLGAAAEPHGWRLPKIAGAGASNEAAALFEALSRQPLVGGQVAYAERIGERRWSLVLQNGSRVELGADREAEGLSQISRNSMLKQALKGRAYVVDVRTRGRIVVRPVPQGRASPPGAQRTSMVGGAP